jgi:fructokinase
MTRALAVGEVLWDRFPDSTRLGGAPLNFAAHLVRLGHEAALLSAVGIDPPGDAAREAIARLGIDTRFLQSTRRFATGSVVVRVGPAGEPSFVIERPAAYEAVEVSDDTIARIVEWHPGLLYFGTLFAARPEGKRVLDTLYAALPAATRFYDVNLRPGADSPQLVAELLRAAHVVKLNEDELCRVQRVAGAPADAESFLRTGSQRFGWRAACVTLGSRGCAMLVGGQYVECAGIPVTVVDTVGAGDAFAAAFVHGLVSGWPPLRIAEFANRAAADIVGIRGALPGR